MTLDEDRIAQLEAHRREDGTFGAHEHSTPAIELEEPEDDEVEALFEFMHDGCSFDVVHEGGSTFSLYDEGGTFVTNFTTASSIDDHDSIEDAAVDALNDR